MSGAGRSSGLANFALALALLVMASGPAAAADTTVLRDDFSQPQAWSEADPTKGKLSFAEGRLLLAAPVSGDEPGVGRNLRLEAAQNYRVSVNVAASGHSNPEAWAGYWLFTPSWDVIWLIFNTQNQSAALLHRVNGEWQPPLIPSAPAPSLKTQPGDSNQIVLESVRGQLTLRINGVDVGTSRVVGFMPSHIQLRARYLTAAFSQLDISTTGTDTRTARLLQQLPVPGQRVLVHDTVKPASASKVLGLALSLLGMGSDKKEAPTVQWGDNWDRADSRFTRDTARGVLALQIKSPNGSHWLAPGQLNPIPGVGLAVSARVRAYLPGAVNSGCTGLIVEAKADAAKRKDTLLGCMTGTDVRMSYFNAKEGAWALLSVADVSQPLPPDTELRLVVLADQLQLYLGGRLHLTAKRPTRLQFGTAGLYAESGQALEVSEFMISEL